MNLPEIPKNIKAEVFPENTILSAFRGSVAHNLFIPSGPNSIDDVDLIGIYVAEPEYYVGLGRGKTHKKAYERFIGKWDSVAYEVRKAFIMLLNANPNILSILWNRPEFYIDVNDWGQELLEKRHIFSSKLVWRTFRGYAYSELKKNGKICKTKRHERSWIHGEEEKRVSKKIWI